MLRSLDIATSFATTLARVPLGMSVGKLGKRPKKMLELHEFEACPFCRKVREGLSMLDLDVMVYPCPKGGSRFRDEVKRRGGQMMFPYLVDPNSGIEMYESDDILAYLYSTYGDGAVPLPLKLGPITTIASSLASAFRATQGVRAVASRAPKKPLELWSFEISPFCRIAREALCSLEIPYVLHNVAKNSPSRPAFIERSGKMQVPYLVDPNTGAEMFESADIVAYLHKTYAA